MPACCLSGRVSSKYLSCHLEALGLCSASSPAVAPDLSRSALREEAQEASECLLPVRWA